MRGLISFVIVFVLGFAACALAVKLIDTQGSGGFGRGDADALVRQLQSMPKATALDEPDALALAAQKMVRSVVNIDTTGVREGLAFGMFLQRYRTQESGSGVIISEDGYVLTNNHVAGNADTIAVTLHDGRTYDGKLVGKDADSDIAVVKIDAQGLVPAQLGNSDGLRVGEVVLAIGNPLGFGGTVTMGVVSATKRRAFRIDDTVLAEAIQTDASINPGNSGGALVNLKGEVVGINTFIVSPSGGSIGLGFAIPINSARIVAGELIAHGSIKKPWIGLGQVRSISTIGPDVQRYWGRRYGWKYSGKDGVVVLGFDENERSELEKAGAQAGDVIVQVAKEPTPDENSLILAERNLTIGSTVDVTIVRNDKRMTLNVHVVERPGS
jgi:S1-C subfamily serine protease